MCGIVGFVGRAPAAAPILDALRRLEYRGYDSAGIATPERGLLTRRRAVGKLKNLESKLACEPLGGLIGIGHTRWATHGRPNEKNAHPHAVEGVAVVHNGIIENHRELRNELKLAGVRFATDTDTEVIAHLVNQQLKKGFEPVDAVRVALPRLEGAFALAFLFEGYENLIIGARKGSPLAVGYGRGEMYLGSDAIALAPLTDMISYLEDGDVTVITRQGIDFLNAKGEHVRRSPAKIAGSTIFVQRGEHRHFMAKEIHEQPRVVGKTLAQYIDVASGTIKIPKVELDFHDINRVSITACGTSFYAGLIARYWFERYAGLPVEIDIASEFRYRNVPLDPRNLAIFVSQSGETADTLASLEFAKARGQRVLSVVNVPSSTMARASQIVLPTLAGPEIGVASTKAFTCQLATLARLAIAAGRDRGVLSTDDEVPLVRALTDLPSYMTCALELEPTIRQLARKIAASRNALFIGRGTNYPLALEGALKLKEISYIHAEGYAAGELKHGPIALIDKNLPVVVIAPGDMTFEKTMSNMHEVIAREGRTILITDHKGASLAAAGFLGNAGPSRHAGLGGTARLRVAVAASSVPHCACLGDRRRPTAQSREVGDCRIIWLSGAVRRRCSDFCLRARRWGTRLSDAKAGPKERAMSCRNGEVTSTILASAKPHYVGVGLPEHGFGNDFDAMIQFYRERGEELRAEYSIARTDHLFWIYFCFRDPRNAEDFAERFGGEPATACGVQCRTV